MTDDLDRELTRIARARAATEGLRTARRTLLSLLGVLLGATLVHRLLYPLPPLSALEGRPLVGLLVVALSIPTAWLAGKTVAFATRPPRRALARSLDDALGLCDAIDTALSLEARGASGALDGLAIASAATRSRAVNPAALWPPYRGGKRLPIVFVLATLFLLFAPGVLGTGHKAGAGSGDSAGIGRRETPDPAKPLDVLKTPEDADKWLREHGRLLLTAPRPAMEPLHLRSALTLDREAPEALAGEITFFLDKKGPFGPVGVASIPRGLREDAIVLFDAEQPEGVKALLTEGKHRIYARFTPSAPPWKAPLDSNEIEIVVPPPNPKGGGGGSPPPKPPPTPPPPQPKGEAPPPPEPPPGQKPPPSKGAEPEAHEEVVTPLSKDGATVKKENAVVAAKDPNAGALPPPDARPIAEALKDFQKVLEKAVSSEHLRREDKDFLVRYLEALRRAVGAAPLK